MSCTLHLVFAPVLVPLLVVLPLAADSADPVSFLVNYGVAGIVILMLVTGQLRTKSENIGLQRQLDLTREDLIAERAANAAIVAQITHDTLPQIANLADVIERLPGRIDDISRRLDGLDRRTGGA